MLPIWNGRETMGDTGREVIDSTLKSILFSLLFLLLSLEKYVHAVSGYMIWEHGKTQKVLL